LDDQKFLISEEPEILERFRDEFEAIISKAESIGLMLETHPNDIAAIEQLINLLKQLYSNAVNSNIAPLIEPLTILEDFLRRFKSSYQIEFTYPLTLLLDRFLLVAQEVAEQYSISYTLINDIQRSIQPLARAQTQESVLDAIRQVINSLLGGYTEVDESSDDIELFDDIDLFDDIELFEDNEKKSNVDSQLAETVTDLEDSENTYSSESSQLDVMKLEMDLLVQSSVFRMLSEMIDTRHKLWVGRSFFLMSMAIKMNAEARNVVDPQQLANAIYLHDFPMVKLDDALLYNKDLSDEDFKKIQKHPEIAYEMASLMGDYDECALMVYQHHERPDGKGYPNQLTQDEICHGAKIIAICDAYYAMTNLKAYKTNLRTPMRAVAEINACAGTQFDPLWVKVFNRIIKRYKFIENVL